MSIVSKINDLPKELRKKIFDYAWEYSGRTLNAVGHDIMDTLQLENGTVCYTCRSDTNIYFYRTNGVHNFIQPRFNEYFSLIYIRGNEFAAISSGKILIYEEDTEVRELDVHRIMGDNITPYPMITKISKIKDKLWIVIYNMVFVVSHDLSTTVIKFQGDITNIVEYDRFVFIGEYVGSVKIISFDGKEIDSLRFWYTKNLVYSQVFVHGDNLWYINDNVIYLYSISKRMLVMLVDDYQDITCAALLSNGKLIFGDKHGYLITYSSDGEIIMCLKLFNARILQIYELSDGNLIVRTNRYTFLIKPNGVLLNTFSAKNFVCQGPYGIVTMTSVHGYFTLTM